MNPNFSEAWNGKGICLYWLGRDNEAMEAYNKAVDIDADNKQAWLDKANLHTMLSAFHKTESHKATTMMLKKREPKL